MNTYLKLGNNKNAVKTIDVKKIDFIDYWIIFEMDLDISISVKMYYNLKVLQRHQVSHSQWSLKRYNSAVINWLTYTYIIK